MSTTTARTVAEAWIGAAARLAAWADANLVNNRCAYGAYSASRGGEKAGARTAKSAVTIAVLERHYRAVTADGLIGLHSTVVDKATGEGEVAACWSRWGAIDIDRHDDATDPEATRAAALAIYERAKALGFEPLLLDSNGRGGYHLLILFDGPVPTASVFALMKWLRRDWESLNLAEEPEVFPKQATIGAGSFGNWLRLPGRHHTHDHHTRVWGEGEWLDGDEAVRALLDATGRPASLIPVDALIAAKFDGKAAGPRPNRKLIDDVEMARRALTYLDPNDYDDWIEIGHSLDEWGDVGLSLWQEWSRGSSKHKPGDCDAKWSSFKGSGRTIATLFGLAKKKGFDQRAEAARERAYAGPKGGESGPEPEPEWQHDGRPSLADRISAKIGADGLEGLLRDKDLLAELAWTREFNPSEYAAIEVGLKKVRGFGAKAFRAALDRFAPKVETARPKHSYEVRDGALYLGDEPLCNFVATITGQDILDDGSAEKRIDFQIRGKMARGHEIEAEVKAEEFDRMGWVPAKLGAMAIIEAGRGVKEHVRAAIQHLSGDVPTRTAFAHTGWRLFGDEWRYLHSGGSLGSDGLDDSATMKLDEHLRQFVLPDPPDGLELKKAIRSSLRLLRFGQAGRPSSRALAAILVAAPYRAILGDVRTSIKFTGPSGTLKSSAAALAQQHFGARMNHDNLPVGWEGTGNGFEGLLHAAKDALIVIDDFAPVGSGAEVARKHEAADRVMRSQANHSSKVRADTEGRTREPKPPRGMVLSTGEDDFQRRSANARAIPVQFAKEGDRNLGTVDQKVLSDCQAEADAGLYAASMAGFIRWLAPRYAEVAGGLAEKARALRPSANQPGAHLRTASMSADLIAGFDVFLDYAIDAGAINEQNAEVARTLVRTGLMDAGEEAAAENIDQGTPVDLYIKLLVSALSSIRAHLVHYKTGDLPPDELASACGWHQELKWQGNDRGQLPVWVPAANSVKLGWTDGRKVYLEPEMAYRTATQMIAGRADVTLPSKQQLHHQMRESGKLASVDARNATEGKGRFTDRVTLEKIRRDVLVIAIEDFWGKSPACSEDDGEPGQAPISESA